MPIVVNLDLQLVKKKMRLNHLAEQTGISVPNLSKLKTGKARAIRFSTLDKICRVLECRPGDVLDYESVAVERKDPEDE